MSTPTTDDELWGGEGAVVAPETANETRTIHSKRLLKARCLPGTTGRAEDTAGNNTDKVLSSGSLHEREKQVEGKEDKY